MLPAASLAERHVPAAEACKPHANGTPPAQRPIQHLLLHWESGLLAAVQQLAATPHKLASSALDEALAAALGLGGFLDGFPRLLQREVGACRGLVGLTAGTHSGGFDVARVSLRKRLPADEHAGWGPARSSTAQLAVTLHAGVRCARDQRSLLVGNLGTMRACAAACRKQQFRACRKQHNHPPV